MIIIDCVGIYSRAESTNGGCESQT